MWASAYGRVVQEDHISLIAEIVRGARHRGITVWLRGGWAMDFTLGQWTRPHEDVDVFVATESLDALARLLIAEGGVEVGNSPRDQQRDLRCGGVEVGIAPVTTGTYGLPVVGGGPWEGAAYPADMLSGARECSLAGVRATAISPRSQIEIKQMMPEWVPTMRRRAKDLTDIARLRAFLAATDFTESRTPT